MSLVESLRNPEFTPPQPEGPWVHAVLKTSSTIATMRAGAATIENLERRRDELVECNNRLLERARTAESLLVLAKTKLAMLGCQFDQNPVAAAAGPPPPDANEASKAYENGWDRCLEAVFETLNQKFPWRVRVQTPGDRIQTTDGATVGLPEWKAAPLVACLRCEGKGVLYQREPRAVPIEYVTIHCPDCGGTGRVARK